MSSAQLQTTNILPYHNYELKLKKYALIFHVFLLGLHILSLLNMNKLMLNLNLNWIKFIQ